MVREADPPGRNDPEDRSPPVSRRSFLGVTGVALSGAASPTDRSRTVVPPESVVLRRDDLVVPDAYDEHDLDLQQAPLIDHLAGTGAPGGADANAAISGFRARDAGRPRFVESGAFRGLDASSVAVATDDWLRRVRTGESRPSGTTVERHSRGDETWWTTGGTGGTEVLRLEEAGPFVLLAVVSGTRPAEALAEAAGRYGRTMRSRAR